MHVVIIGAGVGGLAAAVRLAQLGCQVTVVEARDRPGGLAASCEFDGFCFDAGPYILLDRPGLAWAFEQLNLDLQALGLARVENVYQVEIAGETIRIGASLAETAADLERRWPGCGERYQRFIIGMQRRCARLEPLQRISSPGLLDLLRYGSWRDVPFLLRSLDSVMAAAALPDPVVRALSIWTHVAGQQAAAAPSPLAFVPGLIHSPGAYYPRGGIGAIVQSLFVAAQQSGVGFRFGTPATEIRCSHRTAAAVAIDGGETLIADAVVSNVGLSTYGRLLDDGGKACLPGRVQRQLHNLPLQSPGVCIYLAVRGPVPPPYLRFHLHDEPDGCRLLVTPSVLQADLIQDGWSPARLLAPMNHQRAERGGTEAQQAFVERVLSEDWWRQVFPEVRVLATRTPAEWGSAYHLYQNSMNPVMTAKFMRAGRLAHRCPWIDHLYLTGSATHPGQWVSFCAISGILAADRLLADRRL